MKCDRCTKAAAVHLTDIVNGKKTTVHLCPECAAAQKVVQQTQMNLSAIVQSVLGQQLGPGHDELARLFCPLCGLKYMDFRAGGRLGCPHDYQAFRQALEPLLLRIHRSTRHMGKVPRQAEQTAAQGAELLDLRRQLRQAVEQEAYEEAARLRDLLRQKEGHV